MKISGINKQNQLRCGYVSAFRGEYKEQLVSSMPRRLNSSVQELRPYLKKVAHSLPKNDTLTLVGCSEGLRVGLRTRRKFDKNSLLETQSTTTFTKPFKKGLSVNNNTPSQMILDALPALLGKKLYNEVCEKMFWNLIVD